MSRADLTGWARVAGYVTGLIVVVFTAFLLGMADFEARYCGGPDGDGECDLVGLGGLVWALGALGIGLVLVAAAEVVLARRRRRGRLVGS